MHSSAPSQIGVGLAPPSVLRDSAHVNDTEKWDRLAETFSERDYAAPKLYAARRAQVIVELAPRSRAGETLLDLACGDGLMASPLLAHGLHYGGLDSSPRMLAVARARNPEVPFVLGHFQEYRPPQDVDCVTCLRSIKYADDHVAFFSHVRSYVRRKFVFDIDFEADNPRDVVAEAYRAGFSEVELRPFFLPQRTRVPSALHPAIRTLEQTPFLSGLLSRRYGILFCVARP